MLRCYAQRYPDLQKSFCETGLQGPHRLRCHWRRLAAHYHTHGRKEHRQILCEGGEAAWRINTNLVYTTDSEFPNVTISAPTAATLAQSRALAHKRKDAETSLHASSNAAQAEGFGGLGMPSGGNRSRRPFVTFSVCGGLLNQRVAIIEGLMIAHALDAVVALPSLNLNGKQSGDRYSEEDASWVSFDHFFDVEATRAALAPYVDVVVLDGNGRGSNTSFAGTPPARRRPESVQGRNLDVGWYQRLLRKRRGGVIRLGCTLMSLEKRHSRAAEELFWRIDAALVPANSIAHKAQETTARLRALSPSSHYTALHLRVESDWVEHCRRWESDKSNPPRDNCMRNTDALRRVFLIEAVDPRHPLYVATEQSTALHRTRGLSDLDEYRLESRDTLWGANKAKDLDREIAAFHDLLVCMASERFVGNSVSTCAPPPLSPCG